MFLMYHWRQKKVGEIQVEIEKRAKWGLGSTLFLDPQFSGQKTSTTTGARSVFYIIVLVISNLGS